MKDHMKNLASSVLVLLIAACGGGDKQPQLVDAVTDAPQAACNPIDQSGCNPDQKCTWLIDQLSPFIGHIGCAPLTGDEVAVGMPCLDSTDPGGPPAGPNGFDNCAAGAVCVARICKQICDHQLAGEASGCDSNNSCGIYNNLLEMSDVTVAGACDAHCNVFDQTRYDGAAACGSGDPTAPTQGCYHNRFFKTAPDGTTGTCAPVRPDDEVPMDPLDQQNVDSIKHADRTDGVKPLFNTRTGNLFKNSCAPGFIPLYFEEDASNAQLCTGICAPDPIGVNSATVAQKASREFGDDTISVKLPRSAAPAPGDGLCQLNKKGSILPENCVFAWGIALGNDGVVNAEQGPEGEQFGFCFPHGKFTYDSDNDGSNDTGFKNFKDLPPRSGTTTGAFPAVVDDACDYVASRFRVTGCKRSESMLFQAAPAIPEKQALRFDDQGPANPY